MPDPTRDLPTGHPTADLPADRATDDLTASVTARPGPAGPAPPGARPEVPGFDLREEVGRGGMGVVYRAKDVAFGRDVAVKLLLDKFPSGGVAALRFLDEARITGQLQHPGIPAAYQTGTLADGRPFLAMKLIRGDTLDDLIRGSAREGEAPAGPAAPPGPRPGGSPALTRTSLIAAFEGVCQAVAYAHSKGVVHRDLKPANVMVGVFGEVQVMDWGLAKLLGGREPARAGRGHPPSGSAGDATTAPGTVMVGTREAGDLTHAGSLLGTPSYMPPEQAGGLVDEVDERSDVFGLGAVLCAVLTGRPPYTTGSAESTRRMAARADLGDALGRLDGCGADPELVALCRRCLSPAKADRPATGGEVAEAVARLRADADDRARAAERDKLAAEVRAAEERKRRRVLVALGSVVLLTVLAGGGLAGWQWRRAEGALAGVTAEQGKTAAALAGVTAEQGKTRAALDRVTAEEGKTRTALDRVTAEGRAKDVAQRRALVALRALTDQMVGDLAARQPALTDRDRAFFRSILGLWHEYAAARGAGPEADALRAEGEAGVGLLRQRLGEAGEAERAYRAAIAGWGAALAARPDAAEYREGLNHAWSNLGALFHATDRDADAERAYRAALAGWEGLAAARPDDPGCRLGLATVRENLGIVLSTLRRPAEAEREYRAALAECDRLTAAPGSHAPARLRAGVRAHLGEVLLAGGDPVAAERELRAAASELGRLAAAPDAAPDLRNALARAHGTLGMLLAQTGRPADAGAALAAAAGVWDRLAADYPLVVEYQSQLVVCRGNAGAVYHVAGRPDDADRELRAALAGWERLAAADPAGHRHQHGMAGAMVNLANLAADRGDLPAARDFLARARPPLDASLRAAPDRPDYRLFARNHRLLDARVGVRAGDHGGAAAAAEEAAGFPFDQPEVAVEAASLVARCVPLAEADALLPGPARVVLADRYAARAVGLLRAAVAGGFRDAARLHLGPAFAPLRGRADFRAVVGSIPKAGGAGR